VEKARTRAVLSHSIAHKGVKGYTCNADGGGRNERAVQPGFGNSKEGESSISGC